VASYRESGKGKSQVHRHQDSRSREFRNPDRSIEGGYVKSTRVSGNRHIGVRRLEFQLANITSSDSPIERGKKSVIDPYQDSRNRKA
jgi:hypothetical protein